MNRTEAERVFALVADLRGDLRERLVTGRWWLVWIVVGLEIPLANAATQWLLWRGHRAMLPHAAVWGAQVAALYLTIKLIHRRAGGQRTERERAVWWIWTSFLILACLGALIGVMAGLPVQAAAPLLPLLAAFGFSMMAMAVDRAFLWGAVLFVAASVLMSLAPRVQFLVYGAAWCLTLEFLGFYFQPRAGRSEEESAVL